MVLGWHNLEYGGKDYPILGRRSSSESEYRSRDCIHMLFYSCHFTIAWSGEHPAVVVDEFIRNGSLNTFPCPDYVPLLMNMERKMYDLSRTEQLRTQLMIRWQLWEDMTSHYVVTSVRRTFARFTAVRLLLLWIFEGTSATTSTTNFGSSERGNNPGRGYDSVSTLEVVTWVM